MKKFKNGDLVFAITDEGRSFTGLFQNYKGNTRAIVKDDSEDLHEVDLETVEDVI
jgi:hypothetical protein